VNVVGARRRAIFITAAALTATALTSASAVASDSAPTGGCPAVATVQPFGPWQDFADYFLAPSGDIEDGAAGWTLAGGAQPVEGNEPYLVGGAGDHLALDMPARSTATTASFCVGVEHRTMRFVARGPARGSLRIEAIFHAGNARQKSVRIGAVDGGGDWAVTDVMPMIVNETAADHGNAVPVALRFTARGSDAWQIDDVYVDPYRMG
jgi:hypothetical protein